MGKAFDNKVMTFSIVKVIYSFSERLINYLMFVEIRFKCKCLVTALTLKVLGASTI